LLFFEVGDQLGVVVYVEDEVAFKMGDLALEDFAVNKQDRFVALDEDFFLVSGSTSLSEPT